VLKFGPAIAKNPRAIRPKAYTRWHLDEMAVSLSGTQMYMWRAVDGEGEALEVLINPGAPRPRQCDCYGNSFAAGALSRQLLSPIN
jgi:DDE domain